MGVSNGFGCGWFRLLSAAVVACAVGAARAAAEGASEAGRPLVRHFSYRDFGAHHQVWSAVEDERGLVYFGNKGCVLEFDGTEWHRIPVGQTTFVRGLVRAADGTIYVGAVDEIGYLEASRYGGKRFVSLREKLPAEHRAFGDIWRTVAAGDAVFFDSGTRLFRWQGGKFTVWQLPGTAALWLHVVRGQVYVHRRGEGLRRVEGDELVRVSEEPFVRRNRLPTLLAWGAAEILVCSADEGFATIDAAGKVRELKTEADVWLRQGVQIAGRAGNLVLVAGRQDGVVAFDEQLRFVRRFDEADGLPDPLVRAFLAASDGTVWFCHNKGMSQLAFADAATTFGREQGLDGTSVRALARHRGELLAATGRGVFRLARAERTGLANARFEPVAGLSGRYFALASTRHGLLAGENEGLQFLREGAREAEKVWPGASVVGLAASTRWPERVWVGTLAGLVALDWEGAGWRARPLAEVSFEVRTVAEMDDGTLWLGTPTRGVVRVRGSGSVAPEVTFFQESHGLPRGHGNIHVVRAGDEVLLTCASGEALRWEARAERFVPATRRAGGARGFEAVAALVAPAKLGRTEFVYRFNAAGEVAELHLPGLFRATGPVQQVWSERDAVWLAGADALGRAEIGGGNEGRARAAVTIWSAVLNGKAEWPERHALPPGEHTLAFRFSAPGWGEGVEFATWLEGLERTWGEFAEERVRTFNTLPPGRYTLRVRARDAAGERAPAEFAFTIAAPWWASGWARGLMGLLAVGGVAGLVRWRGAALRKRNERLEQVVAARTAELRASEEQLRSARDAAEAANRAKSAFLAHMSHELRTPLNGILGYAQVMRKDAAIDAGNRERLRVIADSGQHLLRLINEVLDLSKIESGKIEVRPAACALPQLLGTVSDIFRPRAAEAGLELRTEFATDLPATVVVDEAKLTQVLVNLLGNAFKFTKAGAVVFSVRRADGAEADANERNGSVRARVRFAVEDTGVGIAAADLARIFRPFVQVGEAAQGGGGQGTGLGLAISQRIVAVLGGELQVASEPGRGSRFWFELELETGREERAAGKNAPAEGAGAAIGYTGRRRKVLVVDDNEVNRRVIVDTLAPLGFEVRAAEGGAEALAADEAFQAELVLLDLRMAPMDGFAVARELRQRRREVRIVAVSASAFEFDRADALRAGCDGFVPKPFAEEELLGEIARQLGLEWVRGAVAGAAHGARPAAEIVAELRGLAAEGKVPRLRRRLAALRVEDAAHAGFYDEVDALAGRFELKRIEAILER